MTAAPQKHCKIIGLWLKISRTKACREVSELRDLIYDPLPVFTAVATACSPHTVSNRAATTTRIPSNPRAAFQLCFNAIDSRSIHGPRVRGLQAMKPDP